MYNRFVGGHASRFFLHFFCTDVDEYNIMNMTEVPDNPSVVLTVH